MSDFSKTCGAHSYMTGETNEELYEVHDCEKDGGEERDTNNLLSDIEGKEQHLHSVILTEKKLAYKIKKLLIHGSFYAIGICILISGGVSSRFHPHVDPEEYSNCTSFENSSYASGDMSFQF